MKSKKFLSFASVVTGLCLTLGSVSAVTAFADEADEQTEENTQNPYVSVGTVTERAGGYENTFDYVVNETTGAKLENSKIKEIKVYVSDEEFGQKGDALTAGEITEDGKGYTWNSTKYTVSYTSNDALLDGGYDYYIVDTYIDGYEEPVSTNVRATLNTEGSLSYVDFDDDAAKTKLASIREKVAEAAADLGSSETFTVTTDIWDLVVSKFYQMKDVQSSVYTAAPNGSFNSGNTNISGTSFSSISLGNSGTYKFYVLFKDGETPANEIKVEDNYVRKNGNLGEGWYDGDKLIIPIFSFTYEKKTEIKVTTSGGGEEGYVNYRYNDITFTLTNCTVKSIKLMYNATSAALDAEGWVEAEALASDSSNSSTAVANYNKSGFTSSSIAFTPLKKGYFRAVCEYEGVEGMGGITSEKWSDAVTVDKQYEEVKIEDQAVEKFFANNVQSIIFLAIAVVCLIGIIVIALWKPKDPDGKKSVKETAKEEKATEATAEETAEEAPVEEAAEETPAEETTVEEAAEETAEETPVEEAQAETAPVEEVTEEVAPETAAEEPKVEEAAEEEPKAE